MADLLNGGLRFDGYPSGAENWGDYTAEGKKMMQNQIEEWRKMRSLGMNDSGVQASLAAMRGVNTEAQRQSAATNAITGGTEAARQASINAGNAGIANAASGIQAQISQNERNALGQVGNSMNNYLAVWQNGAQGVDKAIDAEVKHNERKAAAAMGFMGGLFKGLTGGLLG